ncbi:MAG: hypothetical protein Q7R97_01715 [Candidatus Daviesbacteria bacterium]|nr:hypothetical protein [Candidatus Daviesbacteria bacterium]
MNPEYKKIYTTDVIAQRNRAMTSEQNLAKLKAIAFHDPGDSMDQAHTPEQHVSPKLIPAASFNTLEVLKTIPDKIQTTIEHGAHFTLAEQLEDIVRMTSYLFVDPNKCVLQTINGTRTKMIAPIPNGPAILFANTPAGENIRGKGIYEMCPYLDREGTERRVWVTEIDPAPDFT